MNNPYDHTAKSANQHNDPGLPAGYEVVETAPGTFETRRVVEQRVDTAAAEMLDLVADVPNQMIDNGRSKSFVFGATADDFAQTGGVQDAVQDQGGEGNVVINGVAYKTSDFQQPEATAQPEPQSWADSVRSKYGNATADSLGVPTPKLRPPQPTKPASWWKKNK